MAVLALFFGLGFSEPASAEAGGFTLEGGAFVLNSFSLSSLGSSNSTSGWNLGIPPTVRAEWWTDRPEGWNFGVVAVPVFFFRSRMF